MRPRCLRTYDAPGEFYWARTPDALRRDAIFELPEVRCHRADPQGIFAGLR